MGDVRSENSIRAGKHAPWQPSFSQDSVFSRLELALLLTPSHFTERGQGEAWISLQLMQKNEGKIIMDSTALLNLIINQHSLSAEI